LLSNSNKPLSTNEIKIKLKIAISQASFTLKELVDKKLISSVNPEDKIGKLYIITDLGKKVLEEMK
jgi:DNA-binding MarR family transcriptional regulator